jgi:transposase InsO family protein
VGLPTAIPSDKGTPFCSTGLHGLSALDVWWIRLGIRQVRIEPSHPEQNGAHERMPRTLKAETTRPPAVNRVGQQRKFEAFRYTDNHERPHEALGQPPPARRWQPSGASIRGRCRRPSTLAIIWFGLSAPRGRLASGVGKYS